MRAAHRHREASPACKPEWRRLLAVEDCADVSAQSDRPHPLSSSSRPSVPKRDHARRTRPIVVRLPPPDPAAIARLARLLVERATAVVLAREGGIGCGG